MLRKYLFVPSFCVFFLLIGCTSNETNNKKGSDPEAVYFDYNIWGDEESGNIIIRAQFRFGGPDGPALVLEEPFRVELDGEALVVDSSKMNGGWFEAVRPLHGFAGRHSIVFTDYNNRKYSEEFDFSIISLKTKVPAVIHRGDLVFELDGLQPEDEIKVLLTDTAYYSRGIDRVDTVQNGRIIISRQDLDNVKNGPVALEFYKEEERPLKQTKKEGGRMFISYGLKRVFELKD